MLLILLRSELRPGLRLAMLTPWLLLTAALAAHYFGQRPPSAISDPQPLVWLHYALNFLSAALFRSITDIAALLALLAALHIVWMLRVSAAARAARPLLGVLLFALGVAALTATGRAADYGPGQAFVSRYVSFSVLFWIGWLGLCLLTLRERPTPARWMHIALGLAAVFAVFNALHLSRKAIQLGQRMEQTAAALRADWPAPSDALLAELYFGDAEQARRRLALLCSWGYPPFDRALACPTRRSSEAAERSGTDTTRG
jgi:hypothetical protein